MGAQDPYKEKINRAHRFAQDRVSWGPTLQPSLGEGHVVDYLVALVIKKMSLWAFNLQELGSVQNQRPLSGRSSPAFQRTFGTSSSATSLLRQMYRTAHGQLLS